MNKDQHDKANTRQCVILDETEITGGIFVSDGDLLLRGCVHGDVRCAGRVVIEEGARVSGNVSCDALELGGTVEGKVKVSLLTLLERGEARGGVETGGLRIRGNVGARIPTLRLIQIDNLNI